MNQIEACGYTRTEVIRAYRRRAFKLETFTDTYENLQTRNRKRGVYQSWFQNVYSDSTVANLGYCNRTKSGYNCYSFFIRAELRQKSFKIIPLMWNNKPLSELVRSLPLFPRASSSLSSLLSFRGRVIHVLSHKSASLSKKQRRGMGERKGAKTSL